MINLIRNRESVVSLSQIIKFFLINIISKPFFAPYPNPVYYALFGLLKRSRIRVWVFQPAGFEFIFRLNSEFHIRLHFFSSSRYRIRSISTRIRTPSFQGLDDGRGEKGRKREPKSDPTTPPPTPMGTPAPPSYMELR